MGNNLISGLFVVSVDCACGKNTIQKVSPEVKMINATMAGNGAVDLIDEAYINVKAQIEVDVVLDMGKCGVCGEDYSSFKIDS